MDKREEWKSVFIEYVKNGGAISPMNTEPCRKYLQEKLNTKIESEDILWLFYHVKRGAVKGN